MLRQAASQLSGCAADEVDAGRDAIGRPVIATGFCSVTHTSRAFGAAAAHTPVGIDVERKRAIPDAVWRRIGGAERPLGESRLIEWTATEAVLKSLGVGLAGGGQHVTFEATSKVTTLPEWSPFQRSEHLAWTAQYHDHRFDGWTHRAGDLVWSLALAHTASGTEGVPGE